MSSRLWADTEDSYVRSDYNSSLTTSLLLEQISDIRSALNELPGSIDTAAIALLDEWLLPVCTVSPYLLRTVARYPHSLAHLLSTGALSGTGDTPGVGMMVEELDSELEDSLRNDTEQTAAPPLDGKALEALQQKVLRQFRHRHLFRILWRDLTAVASLEQTLAELSILAECCVQVADEWSYKSLCERYGEPVSHSGEPQRLIVLGMGKLGGHELNVSSDIDLICLYAHVGQTNGRKQIDNGDFFRRSVQALTRLLNSITEDGFVFRVDTRLRPFGESGPLVMNLEGLENYYLTQARDWERYAMIKARALTGLEEHRDALDKLVTPFIYRRYLDYNAFDSLRKLKHKIALSVARKGMLDNIKLGAGGIREIEFIGQSFQLVRGGQRERLRTRSIIAVLNELARESLMPQEEVDALLKAYAYLRRVENGVQMMRDEQVHCLPVDDDDRQRLIMMMDEPDWASFKDKLHGFQSSVIHSFNTLFAVDGESESADGSEAASADSWVDAWAALSSHELDDAAREAVLRDCGYIPDEALWSAIDSLSRSSFYQRLTADSQERVERIVPMILPLTKDSAEPSETLQRCLALVRAVAGRSGYLQVLSDQPAALARLVSLFAQSRWLAGFVLRQPIVIDELLSGSQLAGYPDMQAVRAESLEQLQRLRDEELDVQMDSLRHYKQSRELRIACAQLDGTLTLMQVSDQLSWLAESLIEVVLALVEAPLAARHGRPCCVNDELTREATVGIVAYGKLGGLELGFGSDLDLVFVHDSSDGKQYTDGEKSIDNSIYYARLAQKFVHFMGTVTPAGVLYEIDLRLRPNGSSGVLVTGIDAFAQYQSGEAWTWEHQALMRARMVLGSETLRQQFADTRANVLAQIRSEDELRSAVATMRERMRSALGENQPGSLHLKQDAGGVADIEFIVQFLVLAHSVAHPSLLDYTDNVRVLDTIEALGLLPPADAKTLRNSYLTLREHLHRQALQEAKPVVPLDDSLRMLRDSVIAIRIRILGEG